MGHSDELLEDGRGHVRGDQVILRISSEQYESSISMQHRADRLAGIFDQDLAYVHHLDIGRQLVRFEMTQKGPLFIEPGDRRAEIHLFAVIT